ncbi:MAG: hypothetical protein F2653_01055 [Actinobacteria bacterium]|uniref:Unannotated protein n=1 Tax=freshwater metagenome TaxID=449393 RepID=A0A6J7L4A2_9ZZZZ|nr:hypothetical protein [Actinomycetota bacterium]MSW21783.1 hypothetical protein [Actinomycetota bacterium]MSX03593.1 hypothetical protein [Actinomycetota bacterium]MSX83933.1 hypothetical protein [Actinomycetota bacterium]MSY96011.1 hypothetical protein [Actinomycetota bacterium]
MKKLIGVILTSSLILVSTPALAHNGVVHKTPKRGQFCPKDAIGHKHTGLKCVADGARARWK